MATLSVGGTEIASSSGLKFPAKSFIGVVSATFQNTESTTSETMIDVPSYTLNITPSLAANKVLVMMNFSMTNESGTAFYRIYRAGGAGADGGIYVGDKGTSIFCSGSARFSNGGAGMGNHTLIYLDSPGVNSAVTYKLQYRQLASATGTTRFNINNDGNVSQAQNKPSSASSITLMEVVT
jgi:hypothetical protein